MYDDSMNTSPINALPPVVWLLAGAIMGIECLFQVAERGFLGASEIGMRIEYLQRFAFMDQIFDQMRELGTYPSEHMMRFVGYLFLHQGFTHAIMVTVFVLALGKFVSEVMEWWAVLLIFFASGIIGAAGFSILINEPVALMGGYPGVFGLIGGFTWILFAGYRASGENQWRAFNLIAFFMGIQLLFKVLFGGANHWLAELIGFGVGFGLSVVLAPGGIGRLRTVLFQLRQR